MPDADEETHEELITATIKQSNPMSKGLGHVSSNYNPANARNPNIMAPKSQYDSYQLYAALPEINIIKFSEDKKKGH